MKALIPLYDLSYAPQVIAVLQRKRQPVNAAVILNVDSGPGARVDPAWVKVINTLRGLGVELFCYIDLMSWPKDKPNGFPTSNSTINKQMAQWSMWYGTLNYFYDDWTGATARKLSGENTIANPGCDLPTTAKFSMIWETEGYLHSKPSKVVGQAVYALNAPDYKAPMALARERGVSYFYATNAHDNPQAYDHLPPYFNDMILAL